MRPVDHELSEDDRRVLGEWVATFGDTGDAGAVRERVRLLLTLRAMHPGGVSLDALLDEPMARAVLNATPAGRPGVMERYRRWCARVQRHGGSEGQEP